MILDLADEVTIIRLTRSLTDAVKRMESHGPRPSAWLSEPTVTFLRTEMYSRDGIGMWDYSQDAEAARRLTIWCERVRTE